MKKILGKSLKRVFPLLLAISIFFSFSPMATVSADTSKATSITFDQTEMRLTIIDGITESKTIHATVIPSDGMGDDVDWTSSDTTVARVDSIGTVTAAGAGTATITATTLNNLQASCTVTVASYRTGCLVDGMIYASGITLNKTDLKLTCGEKKKSYTLQPDFLPEKALPDRVEWSSSDPSVASVDECGIVTAVNPGTAIITAKSTRSDISASCSVEVAEHFTGNIPDVFPTTITLNKTDHSIYNQDSFVLEAKLEPSDVTVKQLDWSSSNPSVATVDSNGKVTGITKGTAVITAKTKNNLEAKCTVQVDYHPLGVKVDVNLNQTNHTMNINDSFNLKAKCNVTTKFEWSSSDTSVATVDSNGKVIGVGKGTAVITAKIFTGEHAQCTVKVNGVSTKKITFSKSTVKLSKGKKLSLKSKIISDQKVTESKLKWSSSNKKVAKVSSTGVVKALKKGTTTITVKTANGKIAKCKVKVV